MPTEEKIIQILSNGAGQTYDGRQVFGVLPDEVIHFNDETGQYRIITPSSDRIKARCTVSNRCGGCTFHHATEHFTQNWKETQVLEALKQVGIKATLEPTHTSPAQSRRRAKIAARRTKSGAMVGFYGRASHQIVPIDSCQILSSTLMRAVEGLEKATRAMCSRRQTLSYTLTQTDQGLDLWVDANGAPAPEPKVVQQIAEHMLAAQIIRVVWDSEVLLQTHNPVLTIGSAQVDFPTGAFVQATKEGEAQLQADVLRHLDEAKSVCDLFCGIGTFALPLAQERLVSAYEYGPAMTRALKVAAERTPNLRPVQVHTRDLFKNPIKAEEMNAFDGAVIDPPRAGAASQINEICKSNLPRLAYVSCSAQSFARDAHALVNAGFHLSHLRVIDQFRWSPHVELVSCFQRS